MCSEHTPFYEYTACALSDRDVAWIPTASLALSPIARAHVRTKPSRRGHPRPVTSCRGGEASILESRIRRRPIVLFSSLAPRAPREVPPAFVGGRRRRRVSDAFDSPERSEDYRDVFATPTEGTRRASAVRRSRPTPRRQSSIAAPRREAQDRAPQRALRVVRPSATPQATEGAAASFVPLVQPTKAWTVDDKMAARGRAASPTKAGGIREEF